MALHKAETLLLGSEPDVVLVRQTVRKWATVLRFSLIEQTKMVTAASELARNTVKYGGGGTVRLEALIEGTRTGLRLVFEDQGPGIADLKLALRDGYTSSDGLGLGLGGARRLCNEFEIISEVGKGTRVMIARWHEESCAHE